MDPSSDLVEHFKLTTEFSPQVTQHTSYKSARSQGVRRVKVVKNWSRREDLGEGVFGTVWLEVEEDGSKRAVKSISKRICYIQHIDYRKELAAMAEFSRHDDLFVEFFGWYENIEAIYLAMEYFKYGDLERYMTEKIAENEVKSIMVQLLKGLRIIHQTGFTHRDLKPQNIFVAEKGPMWWVKIGDFGISKRITNEDTFLRTEIGTRDYLAPEVIGYVEDETQQYTNAVDVWSLGCICHRMLTLQFPFAKIGRLAPYCSGRSQLPIETIDKDTVSAEAIGFVKGMMAAQPAERWNVVSALQSPWLKDVGGEEVNPGTTTRDVSRSMTLIDREPAIDLAHCVHYTSVQPQESQRPREQENLTQVNKVDLESSIVKQVPNGRVDRLGKIEDYTLNEIPTTPIQKEDQKKKPKRSGSLKQILEEATRRASREPRHGGLGSMGKFMPT